LKGEEEMGFSPEILFFLLYWKKVEIKFGGTDLISTFVAELETN